MLSTHLMSCLPFTNISGLAAPMTVVPEDVTTATGLAVLNTTGLDVTKGLRGEDPGDIVRRGDMEMRGGRLAERWGLRSLVELN